MASKKPGRQTTRSIKTTPALAAYILDLLGIDDGEHQPEGEDANALRLALEEAAA